MNRTSVIINQRENVKKFERVFKGNFLFYFLIGLFFVGMLYGVLVINSYGSSLNDILSSMINTFVDSRLEQSLFSTFITSFNSSLILIVISFLFGFCSISQPLTMLIPVFRGLGLGLCMGYLYSGYGFKGVGFSLILIIPHMFISTLAIIISSKESIKLSNLFLGTFVAKLSNSITFKSVKLYCIKHSILLLFIFISAIIDCLFTFLFARFFIL